MMKGGKMESAILSSTVVATIIAGVLSFISARRRERLQYITAERKQWRNEIRKYVEKLHNAEGERLEGVLNALEVRINPWGKNSDSPSLFVCNWNYGRHH